MNDDGQLMMLAGIVLTISFILTALTLAEVSALEREAAADEPAPIIGEWRFLHDRLGSNLNTAVGPETTIQELTDTILPTVQATFRSLESEKGYDLILRAAGGPNYATTGNEEDLIVAGSYSAETWEGYTIDHDADDDSDHLDGIIWKVDCSDVVGALAEGCIKGVYVYVRMTDGAATMQESMLFATNRP